MSEWQTSTVTERFTGNVVTWLIEFLYERGGDAPANDLIGAAKKIGLTRTRLRTAATEIGIAIERVPLRDAQPNEHGLLTWKDSYWRWRLPHTLKRIEG